MSKIKTFIEKNDLSFEEGSRNSTCIIIMGYAQHLGLSQEDLESELVKEISEDGVIQDEIDERWNYCLNNNYKKFWTSKEAEQYIF